MISLNGVPVNTAALERYQPADPPRPLTGAYLWRWRRMKDPHRPATGEHTIPHPFADRVGTPRARCRILARGTLNSALIQFDDGTRAVVSRNALRKAPR